MCGIAGLYRPGEQLPRNPAEVVGDMTASLAHRGPDASGIWSDPQGRCHLGHRRLSIIDTSDAGRQPMQGVSGRWVVTFNGELYNFLELRKKLQAEGVALKGRTDTEVLLACIERWGTDALPLFDGMFAFAAFDRSSGDLLLARDPFGEKPLYYMELPNGGFAFASELQALERVPGFDNQVALEQMAEVLMFQYIGAPRTIYRSVSKLAPGHWLRLRAGEPPATGRYFRFAPGQDGFDSRPVASLVDELEDILARSLRRRLISDVPLGAFLSGGVDSSTVCALVRHKLGLPLQTFSIGFRGAHDSEHKTARRFARHLGTDHHDQVLSPDVGKFLLGIGRVLDEPNADSSCLPTYLLAQFARKRVTVCVSGDGGDELFGGYGRYFDTLEEEASARSGGLRDWRAGDAYYGSRILICTEPYVEELFGAVPESLRAHLERLRAEVSADQPDLLCRMRATDVEHYMPGAVLAKVDRMSMQHALEVRTPFLSTELARFAERLPREVLYRHGQGKQLLRELAYRYLPRELIDTPKRGFGLPMSDWGKQTLLKTLERLVLSEDSRLRASLGSAAIERFVTRQRSRDQFSTYQLWAVAMLESWCREHSVALPSVSPSTRIASLGPKHVAGPYLAAVEFGEKKFVVVETDGAATMSDIAAEARLTALLQFSSDFPEAVEVPTEDLRLIRIAYWNRPNDQDLAAVVAERLQGATLFFANPEAGLNLDIYELTKFVQLGAAQLVFLVPRRSDGLLYRLKLRHRARRERAMAAVKLWFRRVAGWRLWQCHRAGPNKLEKRLPKSILPVEEELSHKYALFEGWRQLPPLPIGHRDIEERGRGRYSVWNGHCIFSVSGLRQRGFGGYWLVQKDEHTEGLLDYSAELDLPATRSRSIFYEALRRRVERDLATGVPTPGAFKRVVVLTHGLPPGGAERQWIYLAVGLRELGYEVHFVVTDDLAGINAHYAPLLEQHDIRPVRLDERRAALFDGLPRERDDLALFGDASPLSTRKTAALTALLRRLEPAVVFAQLDTTNILAAVAAHIAQVPRAVLSFRNYNPSRFSYLRNDWYQECYRILSDSPRVVLSGNSTLGNRDYAEWLGIDENRIHLVGNAIEMADLPTPDPQALVQLRSSLQLADQTPIVLGVFRLSEEKQPLLFLDVCDRIRRQVPSLRVLLAGTGEMLPTIEKDIAIRGLGEIIEVLGPRQDVASLMSIATVMLHTSLLEGMPNAVMEAQALGLPVVATIAGGTPDCVEHGRTGFLCAAEDAEGLAQATVRLLTDRNLASNMGRMAVARMKTAFSKGQLAKEMIQIAFCHAADTAAPLSASA